VPPVCCSAALGGHYGRSTVGPFGMQLGSSPYAGSLEIATRLDVTGMRGNRRVTNPPETLLHDSSYFKAVEALRPQLRQNSLDPFRILTVPGRPKNITFASAAMKKKLQPATWILRSRAKPSKPWTTPQSPV